MKHVILIFIMLSVAVSACSDKGRADDADEENDAAPDVDMEIDGDVDMDVDPDMPAEWDPGSITEKIRPDHPRIFLSADNLDQVIAMAQTTAQPHYEKLLRYVDDYEASPSGVDYGREAMNTAFVYLVTGDSTYLEKAKAGLAASVDFYESRTAAGEAVDWYSTSRISAMAAYDWLYNELTNAERSDIMGRMLQHVYNVQPEVNPDLGENTSDFKTGFYGVRNLLWYAGLAAFGDGIDDAQAEQFLLDGLDMHVNLLDYRRQCSGDDGGSASGAINYSFGAYPWCEFNFIHSWNSATGEDLAVYWRHMALFAPYVLWNWLGDDHEFGYGDAYHTDNVLGFWSGRLHFAQLAHFFRDLEPEMAGLSLWMLGQVSPGMFDDFSVSTWGIHPFLLTRLADPPELIDPSGLPYARFYEALGQTFMRSGSGPDDTYALFIGGGFITQHRHFDSNSFTLYHRGFLALDTGTRLGEGSSETTEHMSEYYARTIAHNAVLIYDPDEVFDTHYWGYSLDDNDGGQNARGSEIIAFETNDDFAYIVGDATACYNESKAVEVVRQFLFLPPHHFVVFDRVISTQPDFGKYWLLHTAQEPVIESSDTFRTDQDQGRLFCRTLLPADAGINVVGGPGSEFMVFGTNYSFEGYDADMTDLMGRYRVEVTPGSAAADTHFLHLMQVGDLSMSEMAASVLLDESDQQGVSFEYQGKTFDVTFNMSGAVGGHIRITDGGSVTLDQDFTDTVQPQSGFPE